MRIETGLTGLPDRPFYFGLYDVPSDGQKPVFSLQELKDIKQKLDNFIKYAVFVQRDLYNQNLYNNAANVAANSYQNLYNTPKN